MTAAHPALQRRRTGGLPVPWRPIGAAGCVGLAAFGALSVEQFGFYSLLIPALTFLAILAAISPQRFVLVMMGIGIVFEPAAIDFTKPISKLIWQFPPEIQKSLPLTMSPFEILLTVAAISLALRPATARTGPRLPLLLWAAPVGIFLGLAYGLYRGGPINIAYIEARGLIFGCAAFFVTLRMGSQYGPAALRVGMLASVGLAVLTILRWMFYTRGGESAVPIEFAFAHESAVLFGVATVCSGMLFLRANNNRDRLILLGHMFLMVMASLVTGRRAATMVMLIGALTVGWQLFPKRPVQVAAIGLPMLAMGVVYLGAFWNKEYGALAQPARAIRSQISPSARDASSDDYRITEIYNVEQTLRLNKVFGVGFGNKFYQFQPLPDLTEFWPLQLNTPHQNVLWLWLKMGIIGISIFLGLWMLALKRCLVAIKSSPRDGPLPVYPIIIAASLLMYFGFARIDQVLVLTRGTAPLAAFLAMAFMLPQPDLGQLRPGRSRPRPAGTPRKELRRGGR